MKRATDGKFTFSRHAEPGRGVVALSNPDASGWTGSEEDCPVPQANNPATLAGVVDAVDCGCTTNDDIAAGLSVDRRQGAYYANAAEHLGLVERVGEAENGQRVWGLTPEGQTLATTPGEDRADAMAAVLEDSEYVQLYVEDGEDALRDRCEQMGLSPETTNRRVLCVTRWADFATNSSSTDRGYVGRSVSAARMQSEAVFAAKPVTPNRPHAAYCPTCFTQLSVAAAGVCEYCA